MSFVGGTTAVPSPPIPQPHVNPSSASGEDEAVNVVEMMLVEALRASAADEDADDQPAKLSKKERLASKQRNQDRNSTFPTMEMSASNEDAPEVFISQGQLSEEPDTLPSPEFEILERGIVPDYKKPPQNEDLPDEREFFDAAEGPPSDVEIKEKTRETVMDKQKLAGTMQQFHHPPDDDDGDDDSDDDAPTITGVSVDSDPEDKLESARLQKIKNGDENLAEDEPSSMPGSSAPGSRSVRKPTYPCG